MEKRKLIIVDSDRHIRHPEHLFCPVCGCSEIYYWPEVDNWDTLSDDEKHELERCPCCLYGTEDFPYDEWEDLY